MMMRLSLAVVLLILAVDKADSDKVCQAKKGKKIFTFSNTEERLKFPCKFNAIRGLICGDWKINVTPGNMLEPQRRSNYVIRTMFVGVQNVNTNERWEGRSDLKVAKKYKMGLIQAPFRKKGGTLETADIFNYGTAGNDNEVSLIEKNNQFRINFGLYDPFGSWHKTSGFKFHCLSDTFVPSAYPDQLCGNGTKQEVREHRKALGFPGSRMVALYLNIFNNGGIIQTDTHCIAAANAMQNTCTNLADRFNAARVCWPILGKRPYQRCYSSNGDNPIEVFRYCVEFMCSGYTQSCEELAEKLDLCPDLSEVSSAVKTQCFNTLIST